MIRALAFCGLLSLAVSTAALADDVAKGDAYAGHRRYVLDCQACHGLNGDGDGPLAASLAVKPTALRDGGLLFAQRDPQLIESILGKNDPEGIHAHGGGLTALDARDLVTWLRGPVPTPGELVPAASRYVAHPQTLDKDGLQRAKDALGYELPESKRSLVVFAMFKPPEPAEGEKPEAAGDPKQVADDPSSLYEESKPHLRTAFIAYLPLELSHGTIDGAFVVDRHMVLTQVKTVPSEDPKIEAMRRKLEPLLESYVGSGGMADKKPVAPQKRGLLAPADVQKAMLLAYTLTREGAAMYEKEERERFWADPNEFKFPEADAQPDNVKFQFKQKKAGHHGR